MPNVVLNKAHELKPQTRAAVESALGRDLADDEDVAIMAFAAHDAPQGEARRRAVQKLKAHFKKYDRRRKKAGEREIDSALLEAMRSVRPGYRERR